MKSKILLIVSVLFGLMFINAGLNKFLNYIPVPEGLPDAVVKDGAAMMEIAWLLPLLGAVEVFAGVLVLFPRTRAMGIIMLVPIMVGIILSHLATDPSTLLMPVILAVIMIWIIYEDRHKFLPILK